MPLARKHARGISVMWERVWCFQIRIHESLVYTKPIKPQKLVEASLWFFPLEAADALGHVNNEIRNCLDSINFSANHGTDSCEKAAKSTPWSHANVEKSSLLKTPGDCQVWRGGYRTTSIAARQRADVSEKFITLRVCASIHFIVSTAGSAMKPKIWLLSQIAD